MQSLPEEKLPETQQQSCMYDIGGKKKSFDYKTVHKTTSSLRTKGDWTLELQK